MAKTKAFWILVNKKIDILYDEIGAALKIKQIRNEKADLLQSLELYFKVFFLDEDV